MEPEVAVHRRLKILGVIAGAVALAALLGVRLYHGMVPWGLPFRNFHAFYEYSLQRDTGYPGIELWINDAGAMHSGSHTFWLCRRSPWTGLHIIYQGEISFSDMPIAVHRIDDDQFQLVIGEELEGYRYINAGP